MIEHNELNLIVTTETEHQNGLIPDDESFHHSSSQAYLPLGDVISLMSTAQSAILTLESALPILNLSEVNGVPILTNLDVLKKEIEFRCKN